MNAASPIIHPDLVSFVRGQREKVLSLGKIETPAPNGDIESKTQVGNVE